MTDGPQSKEPGLPTGCYTGDPRPEPAPPLPAEIAVRERLQERLDAGEELGNPWDSFKNPAREAMLAARSEHIGTTTMSGVRLSREPGPTPIEVIGRVTVASLRQLLHPEGNGSK